ncbi:MAG: DUF2975 domain-containing protein [Patulibacter minatonensis]
MRHLALADAGSGGAFTVSPSPWLILFPALVLVGLACAFVLTVRRPPRALRLAEVLTRLAFFGLLVGTVLAIGLVLSGSRSSRYSSGAVSFGRDRVIVSGTTRSGYQSSEPTDPHSKATMRRELGPGATMSSGDREFSLELEHPSGRVKVLAVLEAVWHLATLLLGLWALGAVLRAGLDGEPFGARAVRALRALALALVLAGPVAKVVAHLTTAAIVRDAGGTGEGITWGVSLMPLFGAVVVLAVAEVWRYGIGLQRESEATV